MREGGVRKKRYTMCAVHLFWVRALRRDGQEGCINGPNVLLCGYLVSGLLFLAEECASCKFSERSSQLVSALFVLRAALLLLHASASSLVRRTTAASLLQSCTNVQQSMHSRRDRLMPAHAMACA